MDKYNAANAMSESTKEEIRSKSAALKEASKELDHFHKKHMRIFRRESF